MASRSDMRAGDSDRERVAEILRDAHGDGRLAQDELLQRIESAYSARTYRDLDQIIEDLPIARGRPAEITGQVMRRPRSAAAPERKITAQRVSRMFLTVNWWVYGATVALCMVIWMLVLAATDNGVQYFWPLWVAGPWGVLLGTGELGYRSKWGDPGRS
ncbi:DUF1707 SHOCT-like domain-containing protein [Phytoactinopolyspora endophytica]|uniref:DUF1707 SHOCT-like domain-containing protein n=1 Tax=Phytoactinopolyspora endophytica TaxID=1642495 RepID=UPI00101DCFFA|nr:DUF1707 domain-containing protein [Phytoactinopolyspora endophytica]